MSDYREITECLACGSSKLTQFADLGKQPLANNVHTLYLNQEYYPLALNYCNQCGHVQLTHSVKPEKLFCHYDYVSGTTKTLVDYFKQFVEDTITLYAEYGYDENGTVVCMTYPRLKILEIGCNDGSLLKLFKDRGHDVVGVDPSDNPVALATVAGIPVINDFWTDKVADQVVEKYGKFDVIIAMNVLGHTPYPLEFMQNCQYALKEKGNIFIQTSQVHMVREGQFDTVYHEHMSYFSRESMRQLCDRAGLYVNEVRYPSIHGTSGLYMIKKGQCLMTTMPVDTEPFDEFRKLMRDTVFQFDRVVRYLTLREDYIHVGYGAAAKATVFYNVSTERPEFVCDDNTLKHGGWIPGTTTPIVPPDNLLAMGNTPLLISISAWNFKDEIIKRVRSLVKHDNIRFIVWHPKVAVYDIYGVELGEV